MNYFALNIILAGGWMLVTGNYGSLDFLIGYAIGFLTLWLTQPFSSFTVYLKRFWATINLMGYLLYELTVSSIEVTWEVLTPQYLSQPDIVSVPLTAESDLEITLLANMVSLTPGSLTLDVTTDRKFLIVHAMFVEDREKLIQRIKNGMEKKLLEVTRG